MPIDQKILGEINYSLSSAPTVSSPDAIPPANPDNLGRSLKLVRTNGGYPLVEAEDAQALDMAERQAAWDRLVGEAPKTVEHFAQNPIAAAVAQNDWEPVGAVEKSIFALGEAGRIPYQAGLGISGGMYGILAAGSETLNTLTASAKRTAAEVFSSLFLPQARQGQGKPSLDSLAGPMSSESDVSRYFRSAASGINQLAQNYGTGAGNYGGDVGRMVAGGAASAFQNAMMLGMAGTIAPAVANTRMAVAGPLIPMGAMTAGNEYQKARDAGLPIGQSLAYAGSQGGIEMATEALPFGILVDDIKASMPIAKIIGKQLLAENVEEQIATHAQDFNEWINLHPEKTIGDYLKERPNAALQTFVQTTVATLLLAGPGSIAMRSNYLDMQRADAAMAQKRADALAAMHQAAAASKTLQRDRQTFEEIVAAQTKDGPVADVYIDAQVLNQSGLADQVVADSPSAAEQYQAALETGAQIRIPVSEYAARIAPQAYAQQLVEDVRFDPMEMSLREAKDYQQSGAMQDLEKAISGIIGDKAQSDAFTASREAVKQQVLDNLNALGRFTPQKNELDATLIAARSATMAAKLGITPEQFFQDHLLKVVSEGAGGQVLNQQPPALADVEKAWSDAGISHAISEKGDVITLSKIVIPEDGRGSGAGTKAMEQLIAYADATGKHIALTPSADFGGNKKRLTEFYKRFGFVENKGKNRAFSTSESMYRQAQGKVLFQSDADLAEAKRQLDEQLAIADRMIAERGGLFAPNGEPSKLNRYQWAQVRTANFKAWFGDWENSPDNASKVVDENGEPLVLYHSGNTGLTEIHKSGWFGGIFVLPNGSPRHRAKEYQFFLRGEVLSLDDMREKLESLDDGGLSIYKPALSGKEDATEEDVESITDALTNGSDYPDDPRVWDLLGSIDEADAQADIQRLRGKIAARLGYGAVQTPDEHGMDTIMVTESSQIKSATDNSGIFSSASNNILEQTKRGWFSPATNTMALLKNADLSTFLHESGHYFLETEVSVASSILQENSAFGADTMSAGKQSILRDLSALFKWFGIEGDIASQIDQWDRMDFEEKRGHHEKMAESFERYMLEGKAPSIELQSAFRSFRQWLISVYESMRDFLKRNPDAGALNDEVRAVFDRMIATDEEIAIAQQARSLIPLFADAIEAGMTPEAFAEYQKLGEDATRAAIDEMQAKGLRDMKWLGNARSRMLKQLQKQAKVQRAEVRSQIRAEVIDEPVYRAWLFLTSKIGEADKLASSKRERSASVDPAVDSLFEAIAKLGGINRDQIAAQWGYDKADKADSGLFGKPVVRAKNGRSIDALVEALTEEGYLTPDENGKGDAAELEERFKEELRGNRQYSVIKDWQDAPVPGQGEDFTGVSAGRIDLASLEAMDLPQEVINRLKEMKMTAKDGGIHPDVLSEILPGEWSSGDELMRALAKARSLNDEIEARTDQVMLETYAELSTPEAIEQAADMAVHNDLRGRMLAAEYNILNKATGDTKLIVAAAREYARNLLSRQKVRDIRPSLYTAAESRAAKALAKATDLAQKAVEKRNQILSFYSAKEAYAIKEEIAKGLRYFKRLSDAKRLRKRLPVEYAEQIEAMLDRYQLKKESANQADKRTSYGAWVRAQLERGVVPYVNELLLSPQSRQLFDAQVYERDEAGNMTVKAEMGPIEQAQLMAQLLDQDAKRSYQDMTVEEFRGLIDTIRNIEHLGRTKDKMLTSQNGKAYEVQRDELLASVRENSAHLPDADNRTVPTAADRRAKNIRTFGASIRKVAMLMRLIDGNKDGGPMWGFFIRSANDRGNMETEMIAKATVELRRLFDPILKKKPMMEGKGKFFESIGRSLIWEQRIGLALNIGNDGNLQRLLDGEGWTYDDIRPVLESITAEEWQAIQGVWDHMDSYRPQIAALERRTGGVEPEWVQPRQFTVTTKDGQQLTLNGGYYPIKYDTKASGKAQQFADAADAKAAMRGAFNASTTNQSFIKSRAEKVVGRPLELSMSAMYGGVEDVIHDLAWREWLIDSSRMMRAGNSLEQAIRQKYGFETVDAINGWISDIAAGNRKAREAGAEVASFMRRQLAAAGMAWNIMNGVQNATGLANSIQRVGAKWIAMGQREFTLHPITTNEWINEKSSFMKHRAMTQFRELNELRNRVEKGSLLSSYQEKEFTIMTLTQRLVDGPTWIGAYRKAEAEGLVAVRDDGTIDDEKAVAIADQAVIDAQGSGMVKDQTALERGGSFAKLFTIYYSYMGTVYNLQANDVGGARGGTPTQRGHVALRVLLAMTLPSALMVIIKSLLTPGDDDLLDDPEKLAKEVGLSTASYILGMVPFLREFFPTFRAAVGAESFGYEGPAGVRVIGDTYKFAQQANQGEMDDSFRKAAINLGGSLFGLPSAQINRTWTGAEAMADDKTDNWSALMFGYQEKK